MGTKLDELQYPYTTMWHLGYLVFHSGEERWYVQLVNKDTGQRTTTSHARYKMSVKLGRFLGKREHVDHVDENKKNDAIENLQILTLKENSMKHVSNSGKAAKHVTTNCDLCGDIFDTYERIRKQREKAGMKQYCSDDCRHRAMSLFPSNGKDEKTIMEIKKLRKEGLSSYKIADMLGIARNTVMKYWK